MIMRYFGLPGCGKTTLAAKLAYEALKSGRFKNVYGNVAINIPGYTYIPFAWVGVYHLTDCCIIIDEAAIECGNRDYKNFTKERVEFFMTHRHYRTTVILFSQEPDGVDTKIRSITDQMFYVKKGALFGHWFSTVYRIPYGLVWPDENSNGENLGKIVMGYLKPSFFARLFAQRVYRPKYYKYFDSWETKILKPLPEGQYKTIPGTICRAPGVFTHISRMRRLNRLYSSLYKRQKREFRRVYREERKKVENRALAKSAAPDGINALYSGTKIHA